MKIDQFLFWSRGQGGLPHLSGLGIKIKEVVGCEIHRVPFGSFNQSAYPSRRISIIGIKNRYPFSASSSNSLVAGGRGAAVFLETSNPNAVVRSHHLADNVDCIIGGTIVRNNDFKGGVILSQS